MGLRLCERRTSRCRQQPLRLPVDRSKKLEHHHCSSRPARRLTGYEDLDIMLAGSAPAPVAVAGLDMFEELLGLGGELPPIDFGAVIVELT